MSRCDVIHAGHGTCKQAGLKSRCVWCIAALTAARLAAKNILSGLGARSGFGAIGDMKYDDPPIYEEMVTEVADVVFNAMAAGTLA